MLICSLQLLVLHCWQEAISHNALLLGAHCMLIFVPELKSHSTVFGKASSRQCLVWLRCVLANDKIETCCICIPHIFSYQPVLPCQVGNQLVSGCIEVKVCDGDIAEGKAGRDRGIVGTLLQAWSQSQHQAVRFSSSSVEHQAVVINVHTIPAVAV